MKFPVAMVRSGLVFLVIASGAMLSAAQAAPVAPTPPPEEVNDEHCYNSCSSAPEAIERILEQLLAINAAAAVAQGQGSYAASHCGRIACDDSGLWPSPPAEAMASSQKDATAMIVEGAAVVP